VLALGSRLALSESRRIGAAWPAVDVDYTHTRELLETMQRPAPLATSQRGFASTIAAGGAAAGAALLLLGTLALWMHYGTAVFFEMLASGFAACF
jgi:hypothetical protein